MAKSSILGPDGEPLDRGRLLTPQAEPSLTSVRNIVQGHPADGLTPQRLAMLLREAEQSNARAYLELAEQMEERDLHYLGVLSKRKRSIAQLEMSVIPASSSADHKAAAKLVEELVLDRLELQDELFDIQDAIGKGFSVTEILWDTSSSQWAPKRLAHRDPRWFRFSIADGETLELWDNAGYVPLAPNQFIKHFGHVKSGLPIRGGLARAVAWAYLFKNFDIKSWVVFAEVFGHPLRVGKYQPGASEEDKAVLLRALRNISTDCAAIVPESMLIEFVEAKMTGSVDVFERLANYLDQQVSKAVLGNTGTTDAIAGGHAVGRVHQAGENDIEKADAKNLEVCLNRDLVRPLVALNMGPQDRYPILRLVIPDQQDISQLALALAPLIDRGLQVGQDELLGRFGLTKPSPGDEVLQPMTKAPVPGGDPADPGAPTPPGGKAPKPGENKDGKKDKIAPQARMATSALQNDTIDSHIDDQLGDWKPYVEPILQPLQDLLQQSTSYEDFLAKLPSVVPAIDVRHLTEALAKSLFAARLAGVTEASLSGNDPAP